MIYRRSASNMATANSMWSGVWGRSVTFTALRNRPRLTLTFATGADSFWHKLWGDRYFWLATRQGKTGASDYRHREVGETERGCVRSTSRSGSSEACV